MSLRQQARHRKARNARFAQYNRIELLMNVANQLAGGVDMRCEGHKNFLYCDNVNYANNILADERFRALLQAPRLTATFLILSTPS